MPDSWNSESVEVDRKARTMEIYNVLLAVRHLKTSTINITFSMQGSKVRCLLVTVPT